MSLFSRYPAESCLHPSICVCVRVYARVCVCVFFSFLFFFCWLKAICPQRLTCSQSFRFLATNSILGFNIFSIKLGRMIIRSWKINVGFHVTDQTNFCGPRIQTSCQFLVGPTLSFQKKNIFKFIILKNYFDFEIWI